MEGFYVKLNLHKNKWLVSSSYNRHKSSIDNHVLALSDLHSPTYEKIVILGDFNVGTDDNYMKRFMKIAT